MEKEGEEHGGKEEREEKGERRGRDEEERVRRMGRRKERVLS